MGYNRKLLMKLKTGSYVIVKPCLRKCHWTVLISFEHSDTILNIVKDKTMTGHGCSGEKLCLILTVLAKKVTIWLQNIYFDSVFVTFKHK